MLPDIECIIIKEKDGFVMTKLCVCACVHLSVENQLSTQCEQTTVWHSGFQHWDQNSQCTPIICVKFVQRNLKVTKSVAAYAA
jgi:hypothetical protein